MRMELLCREAGGDCDFVACGETGEEILDVLMKHIHAVHTDDWFEVEEMYAVACEVLHRRAA